MKKHLRIQNHQVTRNRIKGESFGTNFWKNKLHKESIKTQKVTNAPKLISQSEAPSPKEIMVDKIRSDISVLSGVTGASVTP